eukprot:scaffold111218_cov20-Tisochrysis_lutea.AAC.1
MGGNLTVAMGQGWTVSKEEALTRPVKVLVLTLIWLTLHTLIVGIATRSLPALLLCFHALCVLSCSLPVAPWSAKKVGTLLPLCTDLCDPTKMKPCIHAEAMLSVQQSA